MKVWMVSVGNYDEFWVHSIWSAPELAQAAFDTLNKDEYWHDRDAIVEIDLDRPIPAQHGTQVGPFSSPEGESK